MVHRFDCIMHMGFEVHGSFGSGGAGRRGGQRGNWRIKATVWDTHTRSIAFLDGIDIPVFDAFFEHEVVHDIKCSWIVSPLQFWHPLVPGGVYRNNVDVVTGR